MRGGGSFYLLDDKKKKPAGILAAGLVRRLMILEVCSSDFRC